jgi:hypothetical protein
MIVSDEEKKIDASNLITTNLMQATYYCKQFVTIVYEFYIHLNLVCICDINQMSIFKKFHTFLTLLT